jgi:stage II sporulation protein E
LQDLADELPRRDRGLKPRFEAEVEVCTAGREGANGDRCVWFAGTACRYYVVLCDGMGTGMGAAQDAQTAAGLLRRLLAAGFPAEYALKSLNSLCVLRGRAGAVTADLAEICTASGKVAIYKWGAAPSWLLNDTGAEKIGTATPPPGLSVTDAPEAVERLSLRQGETLILCSDGVIADTARRGPVAMGELPSGELAAAWLTNLSGKSEDDATVAVIRLRPASLST